MKPAGPAHSVRDETARTVQITSVNLAFPTMRNGGCRAWSSGDLVHSASLPSPSPYDLKVYKVELGRRMPRPGAGPEGKAEGEAHGKQEILRVFIRQVQGNAEADRYAREWDAPALDAPPAIAGLPADQAAGRHPRLEAPTTAPKPRREPRRGPMQAYSPPRTASVIPVGTRVPQLNSRPRTRPSREAILPSVAVRGNGQRTLCSSQGPVPWACAGLGPGPCSSMYHSIGCLPGKAKQPIDHEDHELAPHAGPCLGSRPGSPFAGHDPALVVKLGSCTKQQWLSMGPARSQRILPQQEHLSCPPLQFRPPEPGPHAGGYSLLQPLSFSPGGQHMPQALQKPGPGSRRRLYCSQPNSQAQTT